jgi:4-amino-4-deoxy-L-arabinose transferase-like glycosyltransferase
MPESAGARWGRAALVSLAIASAHLYGAGIPQNPPGFYIDESSICYNAYSISQTGRDEFGERWPLYFRAFGDYKNPTYLYLLAAVFRITGPGIAAARWFSASAGVLAAVSLGFLAWRMTRDQRVALLATISALLTPWLFEPSRIVIETALYPLALTLFVLVLQRLSAKPKWSAAEAVALATLLALLTYTYSVGRLLAPLFALGLILFCTRERRRSLVYVWSSYLIMLVPLIFFSHRQPGALSGRFKTVTYVTAGGGVGELLLDFVRHYAGNFNVWRWLVSGDPNRDQITHIFGTPLLLLATFVFAIMGAGVVLRKQAHDPWWRFAFYGLAISAVPASLTNDECHMLRLIALPVFLLLFAIAGIAWFRANAPAFTLVLLSLTIAEAAALQWKFHHSAASPRRVHLFDAEYREHIFAPAIDSAVRPIYLADALAVPGYIQAYWYAILHGIELSRFVRLAADASPPSDGLVISTELNCPRCNVLEKVKPYTLYVAAGSPIPRAPLPEGQFRAEVAFAEAPEKIRANKRAKFRVRVKNLSATTWLARERSGGKLQISLGNHWYDSSGKLIVHDDGRSALLQDLSPGEETELRLTVTAPRKPGDYMLELDILQEGVSWFGLKGSRTQRLPVQVK